MPNPDELRRKQAVLREHCAAVGRDPAEIEVSVQVRADYDDPSTTVATLRPLVDAGATHLVLMLPSPYPAGIIARLAEVHQPEAVRALRTTLRGGGGGPSTDLSDQLADLLAVHEIHNQPHLGANQVCLVYAQDVLMAPQSGH